jgi:DNA-directed RNA polymerase specialized sigma24 family protein
LAPEEFAQISHASGLILQSDPTDKLFIEEILNRISDKLDPTSKLILDYVLEGETGVEIAKKLNLTVPAVHRRLFAIRRHIAEWIRH